MGISGLIPFLEKASRKTNIKEFSGHTVAIDTYCWLHKGVFGCAEKLTRGEDTNLYIQYCMKYVNLLLSHNIKPILVFDGRHLPAKALTEKRRRESRNQAKNRAAELLRLGRIEEAKRQMRRCIDVTHDMALKLIQTCRKRNIDCIVAPYEADAQLAFLNKIKIAQYIITEDSDLVLFGCENIIFKLDLNGNCLLAEASKLHLAMGCHPDKYTFDKFRRMCILSGCDYLDSLPGIGLAKACNFMLKTEETNMTIALQKIPQYLNMRNLIVDDIYIDSFLRAEACFKYMYIYNPLDRKMERLNEISNDDDVQFCSNAGSLLDNDTAFQLAMGNINPFTLEKLDDWSPDKTLMSTRSRTDSWNQTSKTKHSSIWQPQFKTHIPKKQTKINAFQFKRIDFKPAETETSQVHNESEIICLYNQNDCNTSLPKRKVEETDDDSDSNTETLDNKHNPFLRSTLNENTPKKTKITELNSSLLKIISPQKTQRNGMNNFNKDINKKIEVRSRFFFSNTILSEKDKSKKVDDVTSPENEKIIEELKTSQEVIKRKQSLLYSPEKLQIENEESANTSDSNLDENCTNDLSDENDDDEPKAECSSFLKGFEYQNGTNKNSHEIIEISDGEINDSKLSNLVIRKINRRSLSLGLDKKKSNKHKTIVPDNSQSRLSMFGFKKKSLFKST